MIKLMILLLIFVSQVGLQASSYYAHLSDAWYPSKGKNLRLMLQKFDRKVSLKYSCNLAAQDVFALIVPHAGYDYSGEVAASTYQVIRPHVFKRIIILAPSHFASFQGVALPDYRLYQQHKNCMGIVGLDVHALHYLTSTYSSLFHVDQVVHDHDHAIEVQIPFIQNYSDGSSIVPLFVGHCSKQQVQDIAQALESVIDATTLLIISSDFTHYGSSFNYKPFEEQKAFKIAALDSFLVRQIQDCNLDGFREGIQKSLATVCGYQPIEILLEIVRKKSELQNTFVTDYRRSSGSNPEPHHSVSYAGIIFTRQTRDSLPIQDRLTGYEKQALRKIAFLALQNIDDAFNLNFLFDGIITQGMRQQLGVFVSLYTRDHQLRGCIGNVVATKPLDQAVFEMTKSAALHDHRFAPVALSEIEKLKVHISVLTAPKKIATYQDISIGIDGVVMSYNGKRAVFLPQVATEFGWNLETMLDQLSFKAGLDVKSWKQKDVVFEIFQAIEI